MVSTTWWGWTVSLVAPNRRSFKPSIILLYETKNRLKGDMTRQTKRNLDPKSKKKESSNCRLLRTLVKYIKWNCMLRILVFSRAQQILCMALINVLIIDFQRKFLPQQIWLKDLYSMQLEVIKAQPPTRPRGEALKRRSQPLRARKDHL